MAAPPPDVTPIWITDPTGLATLCDAIADQDSVALDTESNSRFVYRERVCLVQLNIGATCHLVDPLSFPDPVGLQPLAEALARPDLTVLLHGGEYDVACFKRDWQIGPSLVWDTQQAASLLGCERTGYGALVGELLGVQLAKEHAQHDWGLRPIDASALRYALDDVLYLPDLAQELAGRIEAADLVEELSIANEAVRDSDAHRAAFDPQDIWRMKGVGRLKGKALGLLVALHAWRDEIARQVDLPPGRIVNNDSLLALAKLAPSNWSQLRGLRLHRGTLQRYGDQLIECIKTHRHEPPEPPPAPARRAPDPGERDRENALKHWRREEAERRGVSLQAVLPARALDHFKRKGPGSFDEVPQFGDKRRRLYGAAIEKLLGSG